MRSLPRADDKIKDLFKKLANLLALPVDGFITQFNQIDKDKKPYYAINLMIKQLTVNSELSKENILKILKLFGENYLQEKILFNLNKEYIEHIIDDYSKTKKLNVSKNTLEKNSLIKNLFIKACMYSSYNYDYFLVKLLYSNFVRADMQKTLQEAYQVTSCGWIKESIKQFISLSRCNILLRNQLYGTKYSENKTSSNQSIETLRTLDKLPRDSLINIVSF